MIQERKFGLRNSWQALLLLLTLLLQTLLIAGCGENRFNVEAENFTLPTLAGDSELSLRDSRGDVVYLTFWASWCKPCREEMPHLSTLWQENKDRGFQVIGINVDEDIEAARRFATDHNLSFPLVYDEDKAVSQRYRVPGYPMHYVLDRRGRVRFTGFGFNEDDAASVSQEVETLLRESNDATD